MKIDDIPFSNNNVEPLRILLILTPPFACRDNDINFLTFRFWVGIWVMAILIVIVAFDLSALVRYITRFTEESFAVLISLIFIFEVCLFHYHQQF